MSEENIQVTSNVLTIGNILSNTFRIAQKNALNIIFLTLAWILTIWIPYVNVGTTIALWGLCIAIARDEKFTIDNLFSAQYRKPMGEFFLLYGMIMVGATVGLLFLYIPGVIIGIAWSQAIYLLVDKNLNPMEAIKISNEITYGEKWYIIGAYFTLTICFYIAAIILFALIYSGMPYFLVMILSLALYMGFLVCMMCCSAYIYSELSKKLD